MILNPAHIALVSCSILVSAFAVYAAAVGFRVVRHWDLASGSQEQLSLERQTYLVSTVMAYVIVFELFSLFFYVYTAENNHQMFVGAMCAAGSLNVNDYGYPTLVFKIVNFMLCSLWLLLNYLDNRAPDYPLIRTKYRLLLPVAAMLVLESILQTGYFINLKADVITSCCGAQFSESAGSIAGGIAALPARATLVVFFLSMALTLRMGIHFFVTAKKPHLYAWFSTWMLFCSLVAVISVISVYFYEQPTHHCPFCILQREYNFIGYPLYLTLFSASILGMGVGVVGRFKKTVSLQVIVPALQKRLCLVSICAYIIFTVICLYPILFSDFRLFGY